MLNKKHATVQGRAELVYICRFLAQRGCEAPRVSLPGFLNARCGAGVFKADPYCVHGSMGYGSSEAGLASAVEFMSMILSTYSTILSMSCEADDESDSWRPGSDYIREL